MKSKKNVVVLLCAILFVPVFIFSCKNDPDVPAPAPTTASYKVLHYKQVLPENGSTDYDLVEEDTETLSGVVGQKTSAKAKIYEGFTASAFEQKTINANGKTVVEIYYDRDTVTLTIKLNGGKTATALDNGRLIGLYGQTVSLADPSRDGFTFTGWNEVGGKLPETFKKDGTYTALWREIPAENAAYTVKHLVQTVDGTDYVELSVEILDGKIGAQTAAVAKEYKGFTVQDFDQAVVAEGGLTVVEIRYNRNVVTLTINLDEGEVTGFTGSKLTGLYGASVVLSEPARQGFEFKGWNTVGGTLPETFSEDAEYTALWEELAAGSVKYTINHYLETVDGLAYAEPEVQERYGIPGEQTAAVAKEYTGFDAQYFTQKEITEDGNTVVKIYYKRITVELTIDLAGGDPMSEIEDGKLTGRYGASVELANPVRSGFKFVGWNVENGKLPAVFTENGT